MCTQIPTAFSNLATFLKLCKDDGKQSRSHVVKAALHQGPVSLALGCLYRWRLQASGTQRMPTGWRQWRVRGQ
jgi:hypothetical protein